MTIIEIELSWWKLLNFAKCKENIKNVAWITTSVNVYEGIENFSIDLPLIRTKFQLNIRRNITFDWLQFDIFILFQTENKGSR